MANTRSLRSSRSNGSAASLTDETSPRRKGRQSGKVAIAGDERRGPTVTIPQGSNNSQNPTKSPSSSTSTESDGADDEAKAEDDDEHDDMADVPAPPSDDAERGESTSSASTASSALNGKESNSSVKSWAGLHERDENRDLSSPRSSESDEDESMAENDENDSTAQSSHADGDEDLSDADPENFDLSDNDDDYGAVDDISVASDDSREFEADVEREIQEAGEAGIDWDDENTYQYDSTMNYDLFGFGYENAIAQSLMDFELFAPNGQDDLRLTQSASILDELPLHTEPTDPSTLENMAALDRSIASGSENGIIATIEDTTMNASEFKTPLKPARKYDVDDGDTTDEDISWTTVSSPGVTLSRQNSALNRLSKTAKKKRNGRKRPTMRRIIPDPDKAIAYSVPAPFGSTVRFCTSGNKTYRWMDLRGSQHSSGASSPTMINLEDAYSQGNTRTGAHITDVINGTLFSRLHCRTSSTDVNQAASPVSNFYRPLVNDVADGIHHERPVDESALALIDFTGGAGETPAANLVLPDVSAHTVPNVENTIAVDDDLTLTTLNGSDAMTAQESSTTHSRAPMTPPPDVDVVMANTLTSPKKRRLSSSDRRPVDPTIKKQRLTASKEVLV